MPVSSDPGFDLFFAKVLASATAIGFLFLSLVSTLPGFAAAACWNGIGYAPFHLPSGPVPVSLGCPPVFPAGIFRYIAPTTFDFLALGLLCLGTFLGLVVYGRVRRS